MEHPDLGLTHVALPVADLDASIDFFSRYAGMDVVHRREGHTGGPVAWISDHTRPFVIVLLESEVTHWLGGWSHLGVGLASRELVDSAIAAAHSAGFDTHGPNDDGHPVGYWAIIVGPDGHQLELSYGQEVNVAVSADPSSPDPQPG